MGSYKPAKHRPSSGDTTSIASCKYILFLASDPRVGSGHKCFFNDGEQKAAKETCGDHSRSRRHLMPIRYRRTR